MTTALFFGDSISDDTYIPPSGVLKRSGQYCGMTCAVMGWTRVGQTPGDPHRAAISGTCLADAAPDPVWRASAGVTTFAARVAAYAPDKLIVNYGSNDVWLMGTTEDLNTYRDALTSLFAQIAALPKRPQVVTLGLMATWQGSSPWWSYNAEWLRAKVDGLTRDLTLANGGIFVPLYGMRADHIRDDGHPNPRGQAYITGEILAGLGVT